MNNPATDKGFNSLVKACADELGLGELELVVVMEANRPGVAVNFRKSFDLFDIQRDPSAKAIFDKTMGPIFDSVRKSNFVKSELSSMQERLDEGQKKIDEQAKEIERLKVFEHYAKVQAMMSHGKWVI